MRQLLCTLSLFLGFSTVAIAESVKEPIGVERGALGFISEWLTYDFLTCLEMSEVDQPSSCLSASIATCNESYFYRHCNNNAVTVATVWIQSELQLRGVEADLIERWIDATQAYCNLHYEFWGLNEDAPPAGLRWDNSVVPCFNEKIFEAFGYF